MARFLVLVLLFVLSVSAFAKPHDEKQPIGCGELWTAVTTTLGNSQNYKVAAQDNEGMKANFVVVGAMFSSMNLVQLKPGARGCDLQVRIGFTGADDEGAFRSRVRRALKKLGAEKAAPKPASAEAQ